MKNMVGELTLSYKTKTEEAIYLIDGRQAYECALNIWNMEQIEYRESFKVLFLNRRARYLGYTTISEGGFSEATVDIRMILQAALLANATCIILCHNHPTGILTPSTNDNKITTDIVKASKLLNIKVLDHIIISKNDYYSYQENDKI